jgi:hypothetical protein
VLDVVALEVAVTGEAPKMITVWCF